MREIRLQCLYHLNYLYSAQRSSNKLKTVFGQLKNDRLEEVNSEFDYYEKKSENGYDYMTVLDHMGHKITYTVAIDSFNELEQLVLNLASVYS